MESATSTILWILSSLAALGLCALAAWALFRFMLLD